MICSNRLSMMDGSKAVPLKELLLEVDETTEDEYALQSRTLDYCKSSLLIQTFHGIFFLWMVSSSLVDVPRIKYGYLVGKEMKSAAWNWLDIPNPTDECSKKAPEKFFAAATRNPAWNLALMVGTIDIPDWCHVETYGSEGKNIY
ncbi:uncharacterized protein LOC126790026 [Argentina anserina]|uniref:uncharacterized protein LOC126790026 n=1 Tax=Argentina anserina TaxID=57926 RepID=UPI0021769265|nr:uncharacterized protein LOC126790026 [Potentilla anserina]